MQNNDAQQLERWLAAAERRYLADLRVQEITRALRALSSAYVERRERGSGQRVRGALDTAGKRAAFALYYAPLHFIAVAEAVRSLRAADSPPNTIIDLGCGTGAAGAAWAIAAESTATIIGIDRHPWAVAETRWTYSQFGLPGRAKQGDVAAERAAHQHALDPSRRSAAASQPDARLAGRGLVKLAPRFHRCADG